MFGMPPDKIIIIYLIWEKTVTKIMVSRGVIIVYKKIKKYVSV
jgi:hypothetical protein